MQRHIAHEIVTIAKRAAERLPWYRAFISSPASRTQDLPAVLTRETLDRHYYGSKDTELKDGEEGNVYSTSGTTSGVPRRIPWTNREQDWNTNLKLEAYARHIGSCRMVAIDFGAAIGVNSTKAVFGQLGRECVEIPYDRPIGEHVEMLRRTHAEVLYAMPFTVERIMRASGQCELDIRKFILTGDVCSNVWRAHVAREFNIAPSDILVTYGSIETGIMAIQCSLCDRFHFTDAVIAEGVRPSEVDAAFPDNLFADHERIVVATVRYRTSFPAVRYATYDIVRGFGFAQCQDRSILGFDQVVGRMGDEVKRGGRISLHDIETGIYRVAPGAAYQVVLDKFGEISIEILEIDLDETQQDSLATAVCEEIGAIDAMVEGQITRPLHVKRVSSLRPVHGRGKKCVLYG